MTSRTAPDALKGRVAVVAGATRGAGRGIAAALGEAGATVICTGRTSSVQPIPWRDALNATRRESGQPVAPPDFALSESPRYVGRAVAALASDPERGRWNQQSVTSGQLARVYGFTDLDGSNPDIWQHMEEQEDAAPC